MFRAFLLVLLSTAVWLWQKTRLPDVLPLEPEELREALLETHSAPGEGLSQAFEKVVSHSRAPASQEFPPSSEETPNGKKVPPGVSPEVIAIEPRFYEDARASAQVLAQAFRETEDTQIEARIYVLNLALTLGMDASADLAELGQVALDTLLPHDAGQMPPRVLEAVSLSLRLVAYNLYNLDQRKVARERIERSTSNPAVLQEIARIFPDDVAAPPADESVADESVGE